VSVLLGLTMLLTDHPHLAHRMGPLAAEAWSRRLRFSSRLEHRLLGLSSMLMR
jgi:hypothetical protein